METSGGKCLLPFMFLRQMGGKENSSWWGRGPNQEEEVRAPQKRARNAGAARRVTSSQLHDDRTARVLFTV